MKTRYHHNSLPTYRPDIDGLRAIAVLSVVAFHVFPDAVKGGFIGVDVFFVISGYLISTIIYKNLLKDDFSFLDFYARRVKRIFPALCLVLGSSLLIGWAVLYSNEFHPLTKHVAGGAGFVSNIQLWTETGYFNRAAELKPLLHLWSLGVEEQFYFVWPVMVWIAWKWKAGKHVILIIVAIWTSSFALNVLGTYHAITAYALSILNNPAAAFYLPTSRFWELMGGSLLAYITLNPDRHPVRLASGRVAWLSEKILSNLLALIGLVLLFGGLLLLDKEKAFPGGWALLPTTGAFCLILAGQTAWINTWCLSNRFLVFIGLISYALYMWHWPLLAFARIVNGHILTFKMRIIIVVTSVLLAWLTYRFVEKPVRSSVRIAVPVSLALLLLSLGLTGYYLSRESVLPRLTSPEIEMITAAINDWEYPGKLKPINIAGRQYFSKRGGRPTTVMYLGDSNMQQYAPRIEKLIRESPGLAKSAVFSTSGGCPPIPNVGEKTHHDCKEFMTTSLEYAKSPSIDTIVVGAQWFGYFTSGLYYYEGGNSFEYIQRGQAGTAKALASLEKMLVHFRNEGKKCYLILNIPIGQEMDPYRMLNQARQGSGLEFVRNNGIVKADFVEKYDWIRNGLKDVAKRAGAIVIDPINSLCDSSYCPAMDKDAPMYKDASHLRAWFVRERVMYLDRTITGS